MSTWIAFIRGIGGGIRPLPMAELRVALDELGYKDVRTYIQSGNVVFKAARGTVAGLRKKIAECITEKFGFDATVMVLNTEALEKAARANPFPQADAEPKFLHLFFLDSVPKAPKLADMKQWQAPTDEYALKGDVFYLYTPGGFSNSKLPEKVERLLGVPTTARNWRTVNTVLSMAKGEDPKKK